MAIQRILVATDGSATAQAAVAWAAELAAPQAAEVLVVTVIDYANLFPSALYFPSNDAEMRERLDTDLNGAWSEPMHDAGIKFRTLVREGKPGALILEVAAAENADLIVMGTRGHGRLSELMLGSVAHHVTHGARTPVVIVPPSAVPAAYSTDAVANAAAR